MHFTFCRSLCSVVCKFNYEALPTGSSGWNKEFFEIIDLIELSEDNWKKIGKCQFLFHIKELNINKMLSHKIK